MTTPDENQEIPINDEDAQLIKNQKIQNDPKENNEQNTQSKKISKEQKYSTQAWVWRIATGFGFTFLAVWASVFGWALNRNNTQNCEETQITHFAQGFFMTQLFIFPFVGLMFAASLIEKAYKVVKEWKNYFFATLIIVVTFEICLLIGASVVYSGAQFTQNCQLFDSLLKAFIITTSCVMAVCLTFITIYWLNSIKACFQDHTNDIETGNEIDSDDNQ